jgi:predicted MPP superfamily phosphohydrolase
VAGVGSYGYAKRIEPGWIEVSNVGLALPRLPVGFEGYRIAQISDIHMGDWMDRDKLAEVVGMANSLKPDLIALTGDFVTHSADRSAQDLVEMLGALAAADGVAGVLGNHDHWSDPAVVRQVLKESGIINVSNGVHTLQRGRGLLHIAGVDDVWKQQDRLDVVLERLPAEGGAILLAHEPDFADTSATTGRFDLQISGHSHGGQVVLPFAGPLRLPFLGRKYPLGLYRVGSMLQYTNRGVGMVTPHVRFNCRPEITLFTLRAG